MQRDDKTPPVPASSSAFSLASIQSALMSAAAASAPVLQSASSTLVSAASAAASSVSATANSYFTPAQAAAGSYPSASAPSLPAADTPAKKQPRKTKDFNANVTAAIALPEVPPKPAASPLSWLSSAAAAASSLFTSAAAPSSPAPAPSGPTINNLIKNLHARCTTLFSDEMTDAQKKQLDQLTLEKIELLANEVREHAARRVDLFFYCCVAVYKTNAAISDGQTIKQHGIGSREHGTQACHSTLFSNLQLNDPHAAPSWLWSSLPSLLTLEGTHLMESLNMTVELPSEVNEFDKHLEGLYQRSAHVNHMLHILNRVSKGEINPQQAMTEFLRIIDFFFEDFKVKYLYDDNDANKPKSTKETEKVRTLPQAYRRIWELQREGSFKAAIQGANIKEVDPNYIYCMLRVNTFRERNFRLLDTHFLTMQREIARAITSDYKMPDPTDAFKSRLAQ